MAGETQENSKHGVPKQLKIKEPRISLTFRMIEQETPKYCNCICTGCGGAALVKNPKWRGCEDCDDTFHSCKYVNY
jgi:hypothetical protein